MQARRPTGALLIRLLLIGLLPTLAGCLRPAPPAAGGAPGSEGPSLIRFDELAFGTFAGTVVRWRRAWETDDIETLLEQYARPMTVLLPDARRFVRGPNQLAFELEGLLPRVGQIVLVPAEVELSEKTGYAMGAYLIAPSADRDQEQAVREGFFMMAFRRIDQEWRIRLQMFRPIGRAGTAGAARSGSEETAPTGVSRGRASVLAGRQPPKVAKTEWTVATTAIRKSPPSSQRAAGPQAPGPVYSSPPAPSFTRSVAGSVRASGRASAGVWSPESLICEPPVLSRSDPHAPNSHSAASHAQSSPKRTPRETRKRRQSARLPRIE